MDRGYDGYFPPSTPERQRRERFFASDSGSFAPARFWRSEARDSVALARESLAVDRF